MSADGWSICPKCWKKYNELSNEAKTKYGHIPLEKFEQLISKVESPPEQELREDYEIFTKKEGIIYISYNAECQICNYTFSYRRDIDLKLEENNVKY